MKSNLSNLGRLIGCVLLCGLALIGCQSKVIDPQNPKFVVAENSEWQLTRADLDREVLVHMHGHHLPNDQMKSSRLARIEDVVLKGMVVKKLLQERAAQIPEDELKDEEARTLVQLRGSLTDAAYRQMLQAYGMTESQYRQSIHDDVALRTLIDKEAIHDTQPTDQEVDDSYRQNKTQYSTPASLRFSRIFVAVKPDASSTDKATKRATIDRARARVIGGENFAIVAKEVSDDHDSAVRGGEMGWVSQGAGEPMFQQAAFALQPGQISSVIETPLGYEFIQVLDRKPGSEIPEAQVRALIVDRLTMSKRIQQENVYTENLLAHANVVYHLSLDPSRFVTDKK